MKPDIELPGQDPSVQYSEDELAALLGYITTIAEMQSFPGTEEQPDESSPQEEPQEAPKEAPKEEEGDVDTEQEAAIQEIDAELADIRSELEKLKGEESEEDTKEDNAKEPKKDTGAAK
jgi:hypothetical protein